ncbi:MAG: N-acetylmuramic acid 6-phosphate etherase [Phycisphaerae bacterium]
MRHRGHLLTEQRNPRSRDLDRLPVGAMFDVLSAEDARLPALVAGAKADICRTVELVASALGGGGRLIYVGAGTSGRLGVLDAAECPPTFLTAPWMVQGVIAGGDAALRRSVEGAEDAPEAGAAEMDALRVGVEDVVFGIATGGTTPFVHGAIGRARERGARTVFLACVSREAVPDEADVSIRILTGPEVVTGSTRMKAGTVTKMVLNTVTTLAMVRMGKVHENLMVDVNTSGNAKLVDRGVRLVMALTGGDYAAARGLLARAGGKVKTAAVMHARGVDRAAAESVLARHGGHLRAALEDGES